MFRWTGGARNLAQSGVDTELQHLPPPPPLCGGAKGAAAGRTSLRLFDANAFAHPQHSGTTGGALGDPKQQPRATNQHETQASVNGLRCSMDVDCLEWALQKAAAAPPPASTEGNGTNNSRSATGSLFDRDDASIGSRVGHVRKRTESLSATAPWRRGGALASASDNRKQHRSNKRQQTSASAGTRRLSLDHPALESSDGGGAGGGPQQQQPHSAFRGHRNYSEHVVRELLSRCSSRRTAGPLDEELPPSGMLRGLATGSLVHSAIVHGGVNSHHCGTGLFEPTPAMPCEAQDDRSFDSSADLWSVADDCILPPPSQMATTSVLGHPTPWTLIPPEPYFEPEEGEDAAYGGSVGRYSYQHPTCFASPYDITTYWGGGQRVPPARFDDDAMTYETCAAQQPLYLTAGGGRDLGGAYGAKTSGSSSSFFG